MDLIEFNNFKKTLQKTAKKVLADKGGHEPIFLCVSDDDLLMMGLFFQNDSAKTISSMMMKDVAEFKKAKAVFIISEVWAVVSDTENLNGVSPGNHPDKKELITINSQHVSGENHYAAAVMTRDKNNVLTVGEFSDGYIETKGRFDNIFNNEFPTRTPEIVLPPLIKIGQSIDCCKEYSPYYL